MMAAAVCSLGLHAQSAKEMLEEIDGKWQLDDNQNVSFVHVIDAPGMSKEDIYDRALSYFTYNYNSGESVIQVQDKEKGLVVGKGVYTRVHKGTSIVDTYIDATHILRIDIKEGKARVIGTLQEYKIKTVSTGAPHISSCLISERYPIAQKDSQKTVMSKAFYKSYKKMMETFEELDKAVKEGNTSASIENQEW